MSGTLDRQSLALMEKVVLRPGSAFKAEVALYSCADDRVVVKDCAGLAPLFRSLFGRRIKRREAGTYRILEGVEGVPAFRGRIDRDAFAIEYIEGRTMARQLPEDLLEKAMASLDSVLRDMHARRVVHLDLKQKRNVLVRPDGNVAVIDFESALHFGEGRFGDFILRILQRRDRAGLIKFKAKYAPHLLAPDEKRIAGKERFFGIIWPFKRLARLFKRLVRSS